MTREIALDKQALFRWLLKRDVHEYLDTDGRPIGEGRSDVYASVETTFKSCPYPGSRHNHEYPMNASALNSISKEWQKVLLLLGELSQQYQAYQKTSVDSFYDLALVSGAGVFLSDYMALRHAQPLATRDFPVLLTGLYKVCLGFQQATFLAMMNDQFKDSVSEQQLPDSKGFYEHLETHGLLIGEDEVCGGSSVMIRRAFDAMCGKDLKPGAMEKLPQLAEMEVDWDAYNSFTSNASNLWRKAILYVIQMRGFVFEISDGSIPEALKTTINAHLKAHLNDIIKEQEGLAVEIATMTIEESDRPLSDWVGAQSHFLKEIDYSPAQTVINSELATRVINELAQKIDFSLHRDSVVHAIEWQVSHYQQFETAVLKDFNQHLEAMQKALGVAFSDTTLAAKDLSMIYGKTISNW
ncbi:hypothetical protein [Leucothrix arctica]|uniref:Uncharacterized protein n=1 Tax=Leucothrix arctica TaxID=1481894 RepID=A0A317CS33_9GAMM|nr:hypothetical protein [Leucothrix arctica]PWQ99250.1 hypothetical protein DKT75_01510 [Leucothrix arctica]